MKLAERIEILRKYFESIGMKLTYGDRVVASYQDSDGIYRNRDTNAICIEVQYENCFYDYSSKEWKSNECELEIHILSNGLWAIETITFEENVILGYFTEDVAKTILESLAKRKTLG